jgi:hypothetical protein
VTLALEGPSWPPRLPVRHLARGPALLGLLVGGSSPSESEDLRTIVGSAFAGRVLVGPDGVGRLGWHLPGLSPAFSLRTGEGYLLLIPSARDVVLPESGQ